MNISGEYGAGDRYLICAVLPQNFTIESIDKIEELMYTKYAVQPFKFNMKMERYYEMSTDQPKKHCDTRQSRQSVL